MKVLILITSLIVFTITNLFSQVGTLDPSFGYNGKVHANYVPGNTESATCSLILPNGKILLGGGGANPINFTYQYLLAQFNADGSFDNTFGTNGYVSDTLGAYCNIQKMALQEDGKIVAAVSSITNNKSNMVVFRFNSNGTFDNSFGVNGKVVLDFTMVNMHSSSYCYDVKIQSDGKILLGGTIDSSILYIIGSAINEDYGVVRLNTDGSLDSSFSSNGYVRIHMGSSIGFGNCMELFPNGDILIAGVFLDGTSGRGFGFAKINSTGDLVNGFGINGMSKFSPFVDMSYTLFDIDIFDNGDIIAIGNYGNNLTPEKSMLIKLKANGVPDIYFGTTGYKTINFGANNYTLYSLLVQPNNQFIVAGNLESGGWGNFMSIRFYDNGNIDNTWGSSGVLTTNMHSQHDGITSIALQQDGKVVMAGAEWNTLGMASVSVCRYNTDLIGQTTLISPTNYSTNISSNVVMKWNLDTVSLSFEVEYSTDSLFANNNGLINVVSDSVQLSLNPATTYYWRVRGWRFSQTGVWSSTWRFTTAPLPNIIGNTISNPIMITLPYNEVHNTTASSGYTSNYIGTYQQASPDIFFQFTTGPCADSILFSTCGSNFDTYIHLLDINGNHIASNDDYGPSCAGISASMKVDVQANTTYYAVLEGYANYIGQSPVHIEEINANCGIILNVKLFLQGYYAGTNLMQPALMNEGISTNILDCDSIEVELRSPFIPSQIVASCKAILKTDGTATCNFSTLNGTFYIVIKHRNTIETWSANPITFLPITNYDFTTAANKAYGNNVLEVEQGVFAFYSGDINQDENIDLIDVSLLEADINNFESGYLVTDINGDGNVDLIDAPIVENNINGFIYSIHP